MNITLESRAGTMPMVAEIKIIRIMTSFFYRKMYFEVRCACSDDGKIIGAVVRANRKGKDVEVFTENQGVYFFPYCDRTKLRMSARRQAYELIRDAK